MRAVPIRVCRRQRAAEGQHGRQDGHGRSVRAIQQERRAFAQQAVIRGLVHRPGEGRLGVFCDQHPRRPPRRRSCFRLGRPGQWVRLVLGLDVADGAPDLVGRLGRVAVLEVDGHDGVEERVARQPAPAQGACAIAQELVAAASVDDVEMRAAPHRDGLVLGRDARRGPRLGQRGDLERVLVRRVLDPAGVDAARPDDVAGVLPGAPPRHIAEELPEGPGVSLRPAQEDVPSVGRLGAQRRGQGPVARFQLSQALDAVAVHVEDEDTLGADEAVVRVTRRGQEGPDALGLGRGRLESVVRQGVLARGRAGEPGGAAAGATVPRGPDREDAEPALGEPEGRSDAVLIARARVDGWHHRMTRYVDAFRGAPSGPLI